MKICKYCNTINDESTTICKSCGSGTFEFKCENCGTVFDQGLYCPHCGVKVGQSARLCPVCKTEYFSNACPTCGYVPGKVSSDVPATAFSTTQPVQPKRKTWLWVLGWIFIFPLPLTLILLKKQNMSKGLKYGLIIAAWAVYVIIGISGAASNDNDTQTVAQTEVKETTVVTEATIAEETETPTEVPTEAPTEKPTKAPTEAPKPTEAPIPITFYEYTDNVESGSNAFVTIQGKPNTEYSIHVYYSTKESSADGLENKVADDNGFVTWEWRVGPNTNPGEYSITVKGGGTSNKVIFNVFN